MTKNKLKIWVVLDVSGFTTETQVYLFADEIQANRKYSELVYKYTGFIDVKTLPKDYITMTHNSLWISGEILDGNTDKYICVFEQEIN